MYNVFSLILKFLKQIIDLFKISWCRLNFGLNETITNKQFIFVSRKVQMSNTLPVTLSIKKNDTTEWYEGTISIEGVKPTKLIRPTDGSVKFPTKSAVSCQAKKFAKSLGFNDVDIQDATKKCAKKKEISKSC